MNYMIGLSNLLNFHEKFFYKKNYNQWLLKDLQLFMVYSYLAKIRWMVCEIIFFEMLCRTFLTFCCSRFVNKFVVKNNFPEP